ncbi:sigma-54 interaction domain-containing protein [Bacillus sp. Marseille-P3800]|uniref:sigma-54 interaction domain-containing protein n=1 Tax=Bacillus sp. Marseille-P3800 TaxID=2014782 RepID=UPI000C0740A1|nr:sigma 54-interacting transcriptional regulator [Bacillus sp. Marseille-P3800]
MVEKKRIEQEEYSPAFITMLERMFDRIPVPVILLQKNTEIVMINQSFADFLGYPKIEIIGKPVLEVDKLSRFPDVLKSRTAEIAWKHTFENGRTAIVHRIPVVDDEEEVLFGFGLLLFQDMEEMIRLVEENRKLEEALKHAKAQLKEYQGARYTWGNVAGAGEPIRNTIHIAKKAAKTNSTVLLLGESGTGKELFAHSIHNESKRSHSPFIKVNCAAIPSDLLESELFGYESGSFSGANRKGKAGKFELAHKGTIFLDEIGEMPLAMQVKLLRVLQEKEVDRVGGTKSIPLDLRIIAATNQQLFELVKRGEFREDLYYRLNVLPIIIPPLRERGEEDLSLLSNHLLTDIAKRLERSSIQLSKEAFALFARYNWPGNVRELENVLERASILSEDDLIKTDDLPSQLTQTCSNTTASLKERLSLQEKEWLMDSLAEANGNKQVAAKKLGISRTTLYEKLAKFHIEV